MNNLRRQPSISSLSNLIDFFFIPDWDMNGFLYTELSVSFSSIVFLPYSKD